MLAIGRDPHAYGAMVQAETGSGTLGTATLALMVEYDHELELDRELGHASPLG